MAKEPKCSLSDLRSLAQSHGGRCLARTYRGYYEKYRFRCAKGHEWAATAETVVLLKHWCELCTLGKFSLEELKRAAASHQGRCRFLTYLGADVLHTWACEKGHEFEETPNKVVEGGKWCPECEKEARLSLIKSIAESHGGQLLSPSYDRVTALLVFRCREGHEFEVSAANILRAKKHRWCPICAGRKTCRRELQNAATSRQGEFLDAKYCGYKFLHNWCCEAGHEFEKTPEEVLAGGWCPVCAS